MTNRRRTAAAGRYAAASDLTDVASVAPTGRTIRTERSDTIEVSPPRSYLRRGEHPFPEGLGAARRPPRGGGAGPRLHRPAPRPRGHEPAGVRRPAPREARRAASRARARDDGPQRPDERGAGRADLRATDRGDGAQRVGVRHRLLP